MSSGPRGRRPSSRRHTDVAHAEDDRNLLDQISNLDLAAKRAHVGWEELLDMGGFRGRPDVEEYERLFEFLL